MSNPMPIPMHPEAIEFIESLVIEHTWNHIGHCGGDSLPPLWNAHEFWGYFRERHGEEFFSPEAVESLKRLTQRPYRDLMNNVCNRRREQLEELDLESEHRADGWLPETREDLQGQLRFLGKFQEALNSNPRGLRS